MSHNFMYNFEKGDVVEWLGSEVDENMYRVKESYCGNDDLATIAIGNLRTGLLVGEVYVYDLKKCT